MKERPILFSAPMARAILEGRKTQTRRVCKPGEANERGHKRCPYGVAGERLWVKETWRCDTAWERHSPIQISTGAKVWYEADTTQAGRLGIDRLGKLRPSIFMPRWASRITLEITEVRVQRLQDISEEDAKAEGVEPFPADPGGDCWTDGTYRSAFNYLWNEINGWSPNAWDLNPWVWCLSFRGLP